jgi:hypothetical protein
VSKYATPRIYDIIQAEVSLLTQRGQRDYFGSLKGQVIGIEPSTETESVILMIRERE